MHGTIKVELGKTLHGKLHHLQKFHGVVAQPIAKAELVILVELTRTPAYIQGIVVHFAIGKHHVSWVYIGMRFLFF
ncbi:hypothetical protein B7993_03625 [Fibrobacter sp. UWH3]|nr:hypothetical protein B7993_03625 [Fibrobacter sp. UWH3]